MRYEKLVIGYELKPGAAKRSTSLQLSSAPGSQNAAEPEAALAVSSDGGTKFVWSPFCRSATVMSFWKAYANVT